MKKQTSYAYEKRIKELNAEILKLRCYRVIAMEIYDGTIKVVESKSSVNPGWILARFKWLLK